MDELEKLKLLLAPDAQSGEDALLFLLLDEAKDAVLDYIGRDELPERLKSVQVKLAAVYYNRLGTEGERSRSEGSVSRAFDESIPGDLLLRLSHYPRKARVLRS